MKKIILSLLTIFMVLSLSVVLVKAAEETTVTLEDGVQIRTDGNNGLRWVANVTNHKDTNEYGFLFAQGDLAEVTIETEGVVNKVVEGVTEEDPTMAATMVNFPKKAATQDISVVAYVKDGENYTYSNVVVRNLSEVAVEAYKTGVEGDFIKAVYDASETTFILNGGELVPDFEYKVTRYNTGSSTGYYIGMSPSSNPSGATGKFWYRIFFKYVETLGLYKIVATRTSGDNIGEIDYDFVMGAFESNSTCTDKVAHQVFRDILALGEDALNYYAQFEVPTTSTCDVQVKLFKDYGLFNNKEHYGGGSDLPEAQKEYYDFVGWCNNAELNGDVVVNQGSNRTLYAKYAPKNYTITYNLNGGVSSNALINEYNIESETIVLPTSSEMSIEGGEFVGWYTNSTMSGDPVTEISAGSYGDIELYASWAMDAPTVLELTEADTKALEAVNPNIIVNPEVKAGKYIANEVEYEAGSSAFSTIADALSAAQENDVIYVFAGTYADELSFSVSNVALYGPNFDVKGENSRNNEANISGLTDFKASGVIVKGFKFTNSANIKISASNITLSNSIITPTATIGSAGSNRKGVVVSGVSSQLSNINITNNYIDTPGTGFSISTESIVFDNVKDCFISGNYITNSKTVNPGSSYPGSQAMIRFYTVAGTLNISNNYFAWATYGYAFEIANTSNSCTEINIIENVFNNNGVYSTTAGINIRKGKSTTVTNVIGNKFYNVTESTILASSDNGSTINVKYNLFGEGTSYKTGGIGSAKLNFENNYYAAAQTTSTSDYGVITSKEALDAAYAEYLANLQ